MVITTSPLVKTYTLQEFWDLPEPSDHSKLELIKGVLYMSAPPEELHDDTVSALNRHLQGQIDHHGYNGSIYTPRAALWIDDATYLEPDLMYISEELKQKMKPQHRNSADIVIEVLSQSSAVYDRKTKADTYRVMGIRELWLVDPDTKAIEVQSFQTGTNKLYKSEEILRSKVLEKIAIPLAAIFTGQS
jgi:Uma2 family endonuclease